MAALVIWADSSFTLGHGRAFALYVAAYTVARGWIEYLRIDTANHIPGGLHRGRGLLRDQRPPPRPGRETLTSQAARVARTR